MSSTTAVSECVCSPASSSSNLPSDVGLEHQRRRWVGEQQQLRARISLQDVVEWELGVERTEPERTACDRTRSSGMVECNIEEKRTIRQQLTRIGGVDISFVPGSVEDACAALVVLDFPSLKVIYESYDMVKLRFPYIASFLGFREVPALLEQVEKLRKLESEEKREIFPQIIMVDGNGILHPRRVGLASHLGLLCNVPTLGVSKKVLHVPGGLSRDHVEALCRARLHSTGDTVPLRVRVSVPLDFARGAPLTQEELLQIDVPSDDECEEGGPDASAKLAFQSDDLSATATPICDGSATIAIGSTDGSTCSAFLTLGVALRSGLGGRCVYVSPGHMISVETARRVVLACSPHRIPDPIRRADLGSREAIRRFLARSQGGDRDS